MAGLARSLRLEGISIDSLVRQAPNVTNNRLELAAGGTVKYVLKVIVSTQLMTLINWRADQALAAITI
ncbi:hypothetical protein CY34DRAFT_798532 [Suillus luteus UH-Slu-Lm8-n1]|uniref:Unplaced genomic scaffold CY34scaffold_9, whole genome shotgun sequence n=1 Tax=Suillus luteus UH-Slu-Lm8-n1 TaxID=930992 RepID=A0A0D0BEC3_9AGAM|nr:hypothetical protein CY34DRAFT_798532 [Suillus luteus UH-Slu-Lm8-n1]